MVRMQERYKETVVPALMKRFGYASVMQVPRIAKITLNMGGEGDSWGVPIAELR